MIKRKGVFALVLFFAIVVGSITTAFAANNYGPVSNHFHAYLTGAYRTMSGLDVGVNDDSYNTGNPDADNEYWSPGQGATYYKVKCVRKTALGQVTTIGTSAACKTGGTTHNFTNYSVWCLRWTNVNGPRNGQFRFDYIAYNNLTQYDVEGNPMANRLPFDGDTNFISEN